MDILPSSPTAFAWEIVGGGPYPPPTPHPDPVCWLCGGPTNGEGWPRRTTIPETFTNPTLARAPSSEAVCQPCVAMSSKTTWDRYVAAHPEMGLKTGYAVSWRSYSHVFSRSVYVSFKDHAEWRQWLLEPPEPPFLFIISTTGVKHLIFRGVIAHSRDRYPVVFGDHLIYVDRSQFEACLQAFEALCDMGFSRDAVLSGNYPYQQLFKVGVRSWNQAEKAFAPFRKAMPDLVMLAHRVARRKEEQ